VHVRIALVVFDCLTLQTLTAEVTTHHPSALPGHPVLLVQGEPRDWERYELAEGLEVVLTRAYEAGLLDGREAVRRAYEARAETPPEGPGAKPGLDSAQRRGDETG